MKLALDEFHILAGLKEPRSGVSVTKRLNALGRTTVVTRIASRLRRMEKKGLIHVCTLDKSKSRHYYQVSPAGRKLYEREADRIRKSLELMK